MERGATAAKRAVQLATYTLAKQRRVVVFPMLKKYSLFAMTILQNRFASPLRTFAVLLSPIPPPAFSKGMLELNMLELNTLELNTLELNQAHKVQKPAVQNWAARGGTLVMSFNTDLLAELQIGLSADSLRQAQESSTFPLSITDSASIEFSAPHGNFEHFIGGALQSAGRFEWTFAGKTKSFADFSARPKPGTPRDLEILDRDGVAWFTSDHVHYELLENKPGSACAIWTYG